MEITLSEKSNEVLTFRLTRNAAPYSLAGVTSVTLRRKRADGVMDAIDNLTHPTELAIINAAAGTVRLTPTAAYWAKDAVYYLIYLEALTGGKTYRFPDNQKIEADNFYRVNIVESYK